MLLSKQEEEAQFFSMCSINEIYEQANNLAKNGQIIADELNPKTNGKKMSIRRIRHLIATTARGYAALYGDVEEDK